MMNMAMTASNDEGNPILNNMGGRCQLSRIIDPSAKTVETHGFCTYVDSADDQIFEQCDFVPGAPNKCKLTGGTGKFEGLQADIIITASPVKTTYDGQLRDKKRLSPSLIRVGIKARLCSTGNSSPWAAGG